jgi:hypothetical protein
MDQTPPEAPKVEHLTDAHLVALLSFIAYGADDDDDETFAATFASSARSARSLLTSLPLTTAFSYRGDRPAVFSEVHESVREGIRRPRDLGERDLEKLRSGFDAIAKAIKEDDSGVITGNDVRFVLPVYVDNALLLGACLMYELLNGGVKQTSRSPA